MEKDYIGLNLNKSEDNRMDATVGILKNIANRNIISNSHALLELIKNSFDEDAKEVLINFIYKNGTLVEIRIRDEGYGFTKAGFDSFKLIGKSQKTLNFKTPLGRITTGMYGSGAYSSVKLGNYLRIISANYKENFFISKEIDWSFIYKNPNQSIRELSFKDFDKYNFTNRHNFSINSGTELIIKDITNSIDLNSLMKIINNDLLYITIRNDFSVRFAFNDKSKKTINFIERLTYLKKFAFVNHTVWFKYLSGKIKIELKFRDKKELWEIDSKITDFQGIISGEYLSIDKDLFNKENKEMFSENPLFKKREALNLFYNNEILILTDEILGLNLQSMTVRHGYEFGFRNSLGYTSIQETQLVFNESRVDITDDSNGQYQKYKDIIDEIFENIVKKIRNILTAIKNEKNNGDSGIKTIKPPVVPPKIIPTSIKDELYLELEKTQDLLTNKNLYFNELHYCINELKRLISQKDYIINFNISFYAIVRVYCEILFIYKVYDFFKDEQSLNTVINICRIQNGNHFKSIGSLINVLKNQKPMQNLFENFREKTNENKIDNVINLIKEINTHIHKPSNGIKESIAYDLIKIFTKWL